MTAVGWLRRHPVTLAVVVVLITVWVVALSAGRHGLFAPSLAGVDPGTLQRHHWWGLITSLVDAGTILQLVVAVVAAIVAVGAAERLMGSVRSAVAFVVTGVLATALGIGLELVGTQLGEYWSTSVHGVMTLDPLTPIAGTLAWASAWAGSLWRRRLRTVLIAVAAALLLYSGQPADLYLLVAVLIGIGCGWVTHASKAPRLWRGSQHETRTLLALTVTIFAVGPVLTLLSATRYGVLSPLGVAVAGASTGFGPAIGCVAGHLSPQCVGHFEHLHVHGAGAVLVSLLPLVLMVVAARGLLAGQRIALAVLVVLLGVEGVLAGWYLGVVPASGFPYALPFAPQHFGELAFWFLVSTVVPLALAVVLIVRKRAFPVRVTPARMRAFLVTIAVGVVVPTAVYFGVGWFARSEFQPVPQFWQLVADLPDRFVPVEFRSEVRRDFLPTTPLTHLMFAGVGPLFWITVVVATLLVIRGTGHGVLAEATEGRRIRSLLSAGSGTLGFLATWTGNGLWVAPNGRLGITYRVVDRFAVTTSDPIGVSPDPDADLAEFLRFCDASAWTPVFYSVHEAWRARLEARGWTAVPIAEETTLDPRAFTLDGKAMHDVRYAVNRAGREGIRSMWAPWHELPFRVTREIEALSDQWMAEKDLPELGFTLGGLNEVRDHDVLVGVALDADGRVLAVTSWLPIRRDNVLVGRTLDFMRRAPGGSNGAMEFLIAEGLQRLGAAGLELASLSATPLARSAASSDPERPEALRRVLGLVGTMLEPIYGFRSLLRFKRKFSPQVDPLYLAYRDPVALPAIGLAIARCYLPTLTLVQARRVLAQRA